MHLGKDRVKRDTRTIRHTHISAVRSRHCVCVCFYQSLTKTKGVLSVPGLIDVTDRKPCRPYHLDAWIPFFILFFLTSFRSINLILKRLHTRLNSISLDRSCCLHQAVHPDLISSFVFLCH